MSKMPKARKKPCQECPFTKNAPRAGIGLGPYDDVSELMTDAHNEGGYACHMDRQQGKLTLCNGNLNFAKVACKRFRNPELAEAQDAVEPSEDVFKTYEEFIKHHTTDAKGNPLQIKLSEIGKKK